ncbi:MAG: CdaR family protein [Chloroflexota bacterium]|nr:CdaR family protein [Chloroflexota bacterium]
MKQPKKLISNLPTLLTALVFAVGVWIFAVTQADPTITQAYPQPLEFEIIGLDPNLTIVNEISRQVSLTIRAPSSVFSQLENDRNLIDVTLDLSGLESGVHNLTPQVNISLSPTEVVSVNPGTVFVKLDSIISKQFPIQVNMLGNPAIGFDVDTPELDQDTVSISGPESVVSSVNKIIAEVNIVDASVDIQRTVDLTALDAQGNQIEGLTIIPDNIQVSIPVKQREGYRTVAVKIVTSGQIESGYRLTYIFSNPPTVTIYSSNPQLVESNRGFVETTPINLNGANQDMEIQVSLNLPEGINVVDSQNITVEIGIDPIESSASFNNIPVQIEGLADGLDATVSPEFVDVFLSGPIDLLDNLSLESLVVIINLEDRDPGTYTLAPEIQLENEEINVDAILPNTIEVIISN